MTKASSECCCNLNSSTLNDIKDISIALKENLLHSKNLKLVRFKTVKFLIDSKHIASE